MHTHCIRCGQCCIESSPTLQRSDVPLVIDGIIEESGLYTIRAGELVRDPVEKSLIKTGTELIKIREKPDGQGCIYYEEEKRSCSIYDNRPAQCRAFSCWDQNEFFTVYEGPKASREDIIGENILLDLIDKHNAHCGYDKLERAVMRIEGIGEKAVLEVLEIIKFDYGLRPLVNERMGVNPKAMDFLLGRPLTETIHMFGLQIKREHDGSFFLTVSDGLDPSFKTTTS